MGGHNRRYPLVQIRTLLAGQVSDPELIATSALKRRNRNRGHTNRWSHG